MTDKPKHKNQRFKNDTLKLLITGALAGIANGIFGAGGGLFLVPLFIHWLKIDEKKAFATSVAVIIPLSLVSLVIYSLRSPLPFKNVLGILAGGFTGGIISGLVFKKMSAIWLKRAFGILIIYGGIRAVFLL